MERYGSLRNPSVLVCLVAALLTLAAIALFMSASSVRTGRTSGGSAAPQPASVHKDAESEAVSAEANDSIIQESVPSQSLQPLDVHELSVGQIVSDDDIRRVGSVDAFFYAEPIPDKVFARMEGKSYGADCSVPRDELRYVRVLHVDDQGQRKLGELVVHQDVSGDVLDIFRALYDAGFPIRRMRLVDDYGADDDASCTDDNTSCFNFRFVAGTSVLSNHAYGLAIDINPYENPYCIPDEGFVAPAKATRYANRALDEPYMIHQNDLCYRLFIEHGWSWGGDWDSPKDYQHFEKPDARWE